MCLIYLIDVIIHPHRGVLHTVARPGARYNRSDVLIDNAPEEVDESEKYDNTSYQFYDLFKYAI